MALRRNCGFLFIYLTNEKKLPFTYLTNYTNHIDESTGNIYYCLVLFIYLNNEKKLPLNYLTNHIGESTGNIYYCLFALVTYK